MTKGLISLVALLVGLLALPACAEPLEAVASFSILGDLVERIGGQRVRVHALVGPNADAHVYSPTPADARRLARAKVVIVNGLGFEGWIDRLVRSAGYRGEVVVASRGITPLPTSGQADRHAPGRRDAHAHAEGVDPHAWQDLRNAKHYVRNIARALATIDPAGKGEYEGNASRLIDEIDALDTEIRRQLDALPPERRTVVSSHDAFAYFAEAYHVRFRSPTGFSTDAEPSAAGVAALIRQIKRERIQAVFMENISDPRLVEQIRAETGVRIGGTLYSDALSPTDGPAASYLAMMRHNARVLLEALR
ncbi:metal ABC transporter substrate-binding protein [Accumulibacter sp.]|uniref:metal ABC transporter substrate-binding protein n=1 Tax=Accumulibacter sp. TaxID=2053492 RepID=UPI0025D082B0|nr:metal ABC transporter substrate-binding protein [Accumulibacter sp.]MCM8594808.1 metal ABC transporter substrate-binding protein [Accumulibacter sp.]MCM8625087.1 metal ABC transporter substrate-binding protein [Accumulibacter sp.]MDS4048953.1 metal ABC transporter substrate-binding protein [Accumulibacter sp.]